MKFRNTLAGSFFGALFLASVSLPALELHQVADFQGAIGYTSLMDGHDTMGTPGHLLYLPVIKLSKDEYFAPVLMIESKQDDRAVIEDTFLKETVDFIAKPAWKNLDDSGNEATIYGSAKRRVSKLLDTDDWSKGLYDYEEFGGGIGYSKVRFLGLQSVAWDLSLMHRSYGNWRNQAAQANLLNYNYYEKDMLIPALSLNLVLPESARGKLTLNYLVELRDYTDSYVVLPDSQSAVDPSLRRIDTYHSLKLSADKIAKNWSRSLSLEGDYYLSNQNYWDYVTLQYFDDYYSFYSFDLNPSVSWLAQGRPDGHKVSLSYELVLRNYVHRNIRNADSTQISQGAEADIEHKFTLSGSYVITRWLNVYALALYDINRSNQEYEFAVKDTYDLFHAELGVGLHY